MNIEDRIQLAFEMKGADQAATLNKILLEQKERVEALRKEYASSVVNIDDWRGRMQAAERDVRSVESAMEKAGQSTRSFGRSSVEIGRFIQDFQAAGINGVANNLEGLSMALGLGGGVAGVVTILAVVLQTQWPKIQEFLDGLDRKGPKAADALDKIKESLKSLADSKYTIEVDQSSVEQAISTLSTLEANIRRARAAGDRPDNEKERGKRVTDALQAFGGANANESGEAVFRRVFMTEAIDSDPAVQQSRQRALEASQNVTAAQEAFRNTGLLSPNRTRRLQELAAARAAQQRARQEFERVNQRASNRAEGQFGGFVQGQEDGTNAVMGVFNANPGIFAANGADVAALRLEFAGGQRTSDPGGLLPDIGGSVAGAAGMAQIAAQRAQKAKADRDLAPFLADDERENERRLRARQQAREKAARDAERDQRAADREREQNTRVGANMFGEAFGNRAQMALMQGMNPQAIARAIQQQLVSTGALNPSQAGDAAGEIVRQAGADLQQSQTQAMAQFGNAMQANAAVMQQLIVNQRAMSAEYQRTAGQFFQLLQQSRGVFSRIQSSPMGSMRRNP